VDCENTTAKALAGFGERLREFNMIVVECCSDNHRDKTLRSQQHAIFSTLYAARFSNSETADAGWADGVSGVLDICFWNPTHAVN
jgi:predicted chitinase